MPMSLIDSFVQANNRFAILAKQIAEDRWELPASATPEWTFRQLVEHIIANNYATATSLVEIDQPATDDGIPIVTALLASTEAADQAAKAETDPNRTIRNQYGADMTVENLLKMGLVDRGLHYWDLAVSLGLSADAFMSAEEAQIAFDFAAPTADEMREKGVFGPAVEVPADAPIQHRLLGITGRDPSLTRPVQTDTVPTNA